MFNTKYVCFTINKSCNESSKPKKNKKEKKRFLQFCPKFYYLNFNCQNSSKLKIIQNLVKQ